nr:hypothetical protein [Thalassobacillus pellis]
MDHHRQLEEKVGHLMNGYTAYVETDELIRLMKREVSKHQLNVFLDQTDSGCWFIPLEPEATK